MMLRYVVVSALIATIVHSGASAQVVACLNAANANLKAAAVMQCNKACTSEANSVLQNTEYAVLNCMSDLANEHLAKTEQFQSSPITDPAMRQMVIDANESVFKLQMGAVGDALKNLADRSFNCRCYDTAKRIYYSILGSSYFVNDRPQAQVRYDEITALQKRPVPGRRSK